MPSLADIPENLLSQDKKIDFLNWISVQPIETGPRRRLISLWRRETDSDISHADFVAALRTAPDYPDSGIPKPLKPTPDTTTEEPPTE